jgi:tetratricopeptide (TPR) repeat protein
VSIAKNRSISHLTDGIGSPPKMAREAMSKHPTDPRAMLASALVELNAGRPEAAQQMCDRLCALAPQDPTTHQLAATIALRRGRFEDALRWSHSCLALRPDHTPALIVAGRAARALRNSTQAAIWFQRASELAPDQPEPAFLHCAARLENGDASARAMLDALLRRFPNDVEGWSEIGATLRKAGQSDAAVVAFARAANASEDPIHHNRLGAALQALGRLDEAIVAFERALDLAPGLAETRLALGTCLRQTGALQRARSEFERLADAGACGGRAWFALGLVCEDLHDLSGAIRAYGLCAALDPSIPEAHVNLGLNLQRSGNLEAAIISYRRALQLRDDTFGRICQALTSAEKGALWLDLGRLRNSLGD